MAVVPTGSPAWTRTVSIEHYGGHVDKENYLSRGAINPLTDVSAEEFSRMVADQAAAVRTADFAVILVECNDGATADPTIHWASLMTGVRSTSYEGDAAPAGFPACERISNGVIRFTFDSSYEDEYGVSAAFAPASARATVQYDEVTTGLARTSVSGQLVTVSVLTLGGSALSDQIVLVRVR